VSGWQLGLALVGCWLLGAVTAVWAVWAYARHVMRTKLDALPGQLLSTTTTGRPVPRPGDYLKGLEDKAREEGGL
jgi:hypothetical protein